MTPQSALATRLAALGAPAELARAARTVRLAKGAIVFRPGDPCTGYIVLLAGRLGVVRLSRSGREVKLYTVGPGELCLETFQCLVTSAVYAAEGRVETAIEAIILTPASFERLMGESADFRRFVLTRIAARFAGLTALVEAVAAVPIAVRLAQALLRRPAGAPIAATHADLAAEIATAREVVSRTLERWALEGHLRMARGRIDILNRDALSRFASGDR
jgi:CRP/FNR family transcriptional regulator